MIAGKENGPPWKSVFNLPTLLLGYELRYGLCERKLFYENNYLVSYFWLSWVFFFFLFFCVGFFSGFGEQGLLSSCGTRAPHCCGLCCCRTQAPGLARSVVVVLRL